MKFTPFTYCSSAVLIVASTGLLVRSGEAQTPGVPHGGGHCETDDDCSLGGECQESKCVCDPWFTGPNCVLLNLQPPKDMEGGTCGKGFDSYYSWGGRTIADPADENTYHLYASFMCEHKNLGSWTSDSSSAHFVSSNGPV